MKAKVVSNDRIGEGLYRMKLDAGKKISAKPGQFINVLVSESYTPLLRRPFSIYDADARTVEIVYKALGAATKVLADKKSGDVLDFLGPLGKPYLDFNSALRTPHSAIVVIGGGTGAASTYFLAKVLKKNKVRFTFIQGAQNKSQIVAAAEFKKLGCIFTTDDGSLGEKGFVTDVLSRVIDEAQTIKRNPKRSSKSEKQRFTIFACGPKPMFAAIKKLAEKRTNISVYASFEEYMGCGIGACLSCAVEVKKGDYTEYKRVCKDGPVFNLSDVVF
jgi:dihydroorotate dehydrogenase electron transfer subunit